MCARTSDDRALPREQRPRRVAQQLLFVAQREVHVVLRPRQPEDAGGDDVALDLTRPAADGVGEADEERTRPAAALVAPLGVVDGPYGPCSSMPSSYIALRTSLVAIFRKLCSGAEVPWANDENPL